MAKHFRKPGYDSLQFNNHGFDKNYEAKTYLNCSFIDCKFSSAGLYRTEFQRGEFRCCSFEKAQLTRTIFRDCSFFDCTFEYAQLDKTDFEASFFSNCSFAHAGGDDTSFTFVRAGHGNNFSEVELDRASFYSSCLVEADFKHARLTYCSFVTANLSRAAFNFASMFGCNFLDADLNDVIGLDPLVAAQLSILPAGELIVYKKLLNQCIAELIIPTHALRSNATGRKCRASEAKVLAIWDEDGNSIETGYSYYDETFLYVVGATVYSTQPPAKAYSQVCGETNLIDPKWHYFRNDRWEECGEGIHFFLTKEEAQDYNP